MLVSIIIPTYNEEKNLPVILEALKAQAFRDFEVVVADAKSTDRTREIAEEFGARVVDGGNPSEGRNRGAAAAGADILFFLDADVKPHADFLERAVREFEHRDLGVASAEFLPMSDLLRDKILHKIVWYYFLTVQRWFPHTPGFCIITTKPVFDGVGGFDESIKLAEDHVYAKAAAQNSKHGYLRNVKIPVSVRRMAKDGRFGNAVTYLRAEWHLIFRGPIKDDKFKYEFGHDEQSVKESAKREMSKEIRADSEQ